MTPDPTAPPPFAHLLPQREVALRAIAKLASEGGWPVPPLQERRSPCSNRVDFRGFDPDGKEFGVGYEWTDQQAKIAMAQVRP